MQNERIYTVNIGNKTLEIPYEEIMFIEISNVPHRLTLHRENDQLQYYGSLKRVEQEISAFYRCHGSFMINPENIKAIDKVNRKIEMVNGKICPVSNRAMKRLVHLIEDN